MVILGRTEKESKRDENEESIPNASRSRRMTTLRCVCGGVVPHSPIEKKGNVSFRGRLQ
jgi:hypothetical protein